MKINIILPLLIPIIIAGGVIFYNETNDKVLTNRLNSNNFLITENNNDYQIDNVENLTSKLVVEANKIKEEIVENHNQTDLVKNAEYILEKANHIQTLNSIEDIKISNEDYKKIVSAYESLETYTKSFFQNPTENALNLEQEDIEKIQNAYSFAPTIISLVDNAKKIQNNDYNKCDERLVNALSSCSQYTCEMYNSDLGILSPYSVLGKNTIENCGYTYTYNKLPFVCGLSTDSKQGVINFLRNEIGKDDMNLSYDPNKLPANYTTIEEGSKQLEGCILIALGGQLEQFK